MQMKPLRPSPGPILRYLAQLEPNQAQGVHMALQDLFAQPEGKILMELLEKSIQDRLIPEAAPAGALGDREAQRFIVSDLQQIVRGPDAYQPVRRRGDTPSRTDL